MWQQEEAMKVVCPRPAKTEMQCSFMPPGGDKGHQNVHTTFTWRQILSADCEKTFTSSVNVYKYYLNKCSCNKKISEILQNLWKECRFPGESKMAAVVVNRPPLSDTVLGHHILPHFLFFPSFPGSVSCITCLLSQCICCVLDLDQYEWNRQALLKVLHEATETATIRWNTVILFWGVVLCHK